MSKLRFNYLYLMVLATISLLSFVSVTIVHADSTNPTPTKEFVVDDYAGLLSDKTKSVIINKEKSYQKTNTKPQVVVMTIKSTNDQPISSYTGDLLRNDRWHIGNKKNNNGVLILFAQNGGKNNIRINVGYGLEGVLPDITCHKILKAHEDDLKSKDNARVEKGMIGVFSDVTTIVDKTTKTMPAKKANTTVIWFVIIIALIIISAVLYKVLSERTTTHYDDNDDDDDSSHGGGSSMLDMLTAFGAGYSSGHSSDSSWGDSGWGSSDSGWGDSGWGGDSGFSDSGGGGSDGGGGADM